ncbi:MAG TPA: hypothetical protein QF533_09540 [Nitrospinota bacterium]|jgi:hypothetical protein|nr:hypothetical protein [Nitrospinota bacterium]MDP7664949.1 hypothetical protein [Nitrospinota bacterium]HJP14567.1 hypothetical protein [Nitrospinota bacterium]
MPKPEDMKLFEALEDSVDNEEVDKILARIESGEEEVLDWAEAKMELRGED